VSMISTPAVGARCALGLAAELFEQGLREGTPPRLCTRMPRNPAIFVQAGEFLCKVPGWQGMSGRHCRGRASAQNTQAEPFRPAPAG
jgi:hypothetical protein